MQGQQGSQMFDVEMGKCPMSNRTTTQICPQNRTQGGCPFMQNDDKKDPELGPLQELYDTQYISLYSYLIETNKEMSFFKLKNQVSRSVFDTYPIYLKHTLFFDDEDTKKLRELETGQRYLIYDKYRQQANKLMQQSEYEEALRFYERAFGCFKWLEIIDDSDEYEENQLQQKYKAYTTVFSDTNVLLHSPDDLSDQFDLEIANSMLFQLSLNMSVCYMKMSHFKLAEIILNDAKLLYRQSQAIAYNKSSTYNELLNAEKLIIQSIEIMSEEKIFKQSKPTVLKLIGLENAKEFYINHAIYVKERLKQKHDWIEIRIRELMEREKDMEEIEQDLIQQGRTPICDGLSDDEICYIPSEENKTQEQPEQKLYRQCRNQLNLEHEQYEIVKMMVKRYYNLIQFYMEQRQTNQLKQAQKELQQLLITEQEMKFYMELDFIKYKQDEQQIINELNQEFKIDLTQKKVIIRLNNLRRERVRDLFDEGSFNYTILSYSMQEYYKNKKKQQQKDQIEVNEMKKISSSQAIIKLMFNHICTKEALIQLFIFLLVFVGLLIIGRSNITINQIFGSIK